MLRKILFITPIISVFFISCEQEMNLVGSDIVGGEHFEGINKGTYNVNDLVNIRTGEVQTNNLPLNPLGVFNDPYFGKTVASYVTQLNIATSQPDFGSNIDVKDVVLYVPYFATEKTSDTEGNKTYVLDSIFPKPQGSVDIDEFNSNKMKLSIYENGYMLNSFGGVNNDEIPKYYSDLGGTNIDAVKIGNSGGNPVTNATRLNDGDAAENNQFFFNDDQIIEYKRALVNGNYVYVDANGVELANQNDVSTRVVSSRLSPGIYIHLNKDYFENRILLASSNNVYNNNAFRAYFKGLYFKIEDIVGVDGAMAMLNFNKGKVQIYYSSKKGSETNDTMKELNLTFGTNSGANCVSLLNSTSGNSVSFTNDFNANNKERVYLKGGVGAVSYFKLFEDNQVELINLYNEVKDKKKLINDAYVDFYLDKNKFASDSELKNVAKRIYLYDGSNQMPILDYVNDISVFPGNIKNNQYIYGGILQKNSNGDYFYRVRIVNWLNRLLTSSTLNDLNERNVPFGLSVSESISLFSSYYYKNEVTPFPGSNVAKYFPMASIISPVGTVLHGPNSEDDAKKMKLTIHYTKLND